MFWEVEILNEVVKGRPSRGVIFEGRWDEG